MVETAITFDDVLLIPAYNHPQSRRIVDTSMTDKSGKLTLKLPSNCPGKERQAGGSLQYSS